MHYTGESGLLDRGVFVRLAPPDYRRPGGPQHTRVCIPRAEVPRPVPILGDGARPTGGNAGQPPRPTWSPSTRASVRRGLAHQGPSSGLMWPRPRWVRTRRAADPAPG